MKQILSIWSTLMMTVSSAAFAQTNTAHGGGAANPPANTAPGTHSSSGGMRRQLTNNLTRAGFTNVKVMPDSFLVQAKDRSGNLVTMFIPPDSMTVLTSEDRNGADNGMGSNRHARDDSRTGGLFVNVASAEDLSSKVVGLKIHNSADQDVGKIEDVALDGNRVTAYIVAVGGFLGMSDHYVAVRPASVKISYNDSDKKWHATMNTDADRLKAAPEYKYSSN